MTKYLTYREFIDLYENKGYSIHEIINEVKGDIPLTNDLKTLIADNVFNDKMVLFRANISFILNDDITKFLTDNCGYALLTSDKKIRYFYIYSNPFSIFKSKYENTKIFNKLAFQDMKDQIKIFQELNLKDVPEIYELFKKINEILPDFQKNFKNIKNWNDLYIK